MEGRKYGFNIERHNLRKLDALRYAKEGTLGQKLDEVFGRQAD